VSDSYVIIIVPTIVRYRSRNIYFCSPTLLACMPIITVLIVGETEYKQIRCIATYILLVHVQTYPLICTYEKRSIKSLNSCGILYFISRKQALV
jgi:hypothetical protein